MFTEELALRICERLAAGETLREVCRSDEMPSPQTVLSWKNAYPTFSEQYAKARKLGYEHMADELLEIADDASNDWMERNDEKSEGWQFNGDHYQRSRLRVDTRKWLLSKALPKVYGDKQQIVGGADDDAPVRVITEIRRSIVDPRHSDG